MFLLQDIPTPETLLALSSRYPALDPAALRTCILLLQTGRALQAEFDGFLAKHGLSQGRFLTLVVMHRTPETPANPSDLAAKVGVKPASMTGLLDGLEREGLVERVPHPSDRRKVNVRLGAKGKARLDAILPSYYAHIASLTADITTEEQVVLARLLSKVSARIAP